jgi:hypothetical protein
MFGWEDKVRGNDPVSCLDEGIEIEYVDRMCTYDHLPHNAGKVTSFCIENILLINRMAYHCHYMS